MEPNVSLYSRKVLIESKSKHIFPDWLRFVSGVVDSEDLPLSISRENMQDSGLIRKIQSVLTKRIIRFLADQAKKDSKVYDEFFTEFGTWCSSVKRENISLSYLLTQRTHEFEREARECQLYHSLMEYHLNTHSNTNT